MKDMMIRLCLLVTLVGTTVAQESPIKNFKIVAINGRKDVKVLNSENTLAPKPSVNQELNFGTTIKTGRRTTVDLSFSEGNTFRILARTKIKITENARDPRLKVLHVSAGSVEMKLDKYPEGHKLQVETPTAVCGVVGTRFIVSFESHRKILVMKMVAVTKMQIVVRMMKETFLVIVK